MIAQPRRNAASETIAARLLIVEARYYETIADELLVGATSAVETAGASAVTITVPGALEIPTAVAMALDAADEAGQPFDGVVALGCVIRGETSHYDIVAGESARLLADISLTRRLPLGNAILTVDTMEQAEARAGVARGNKGGFATEAALTLIALKRRLPELVGDAK